MKNLFRNVIIFFQSISGAEAVGVLILLVTGIALAYSVIFLVIRAAACVIDFVISLI